jgi:hypothetical protein
MWRKIRERDTMRERYRKGGRRDDENEEETRGR